MDYAFRLAVGKQHLVAVCLTAVFSLLSPGDARADFPAKPLWRSCNEDPDGGGTPGNMPLRFPGQYFDKETQTSYNYYRDYDPSIGRYVESDPIGFGGGNNSYLYVGANPMRYVDPLGLALVNPGEYGAGGGGGVAGGGGGAGLGGLLLIGAAAAWNAVINMNSSSDKEGSSSSSLAQGDKSASAASQRQEEYERYKRRCSESPPDGLDECARLRWLLQREKDCVEGMRQWDRKWQPGRHDEAIRQRTSGIVRLEKLIQQKCCP